MSIVLSAWDSRLTVAAMAIASVGGSLSCISDPDCGVCDPDNLVLQSVSGVNYASKTVHLLSPACEGDRCPEPLDEGSYFVEDIGPCETSEAALLLPNEAMRREFCRLSPLVSTYGIEFVFNNLLDPESIELVRKRPDDPNLFEVYDWKPDILHVEGPITRYNGDYRVGSGNDSPDSMTRLVNLSCIDNLRDDGIAFSAEDYADPATNPCNDVDADGLPRKMWREGEARSYRGTWTSTSNDCSSNVEGPDECCTHCEFLLSTRIARYGVTEPMPDDRPIGEVPPGSIRNPNGGAAPAITCDDVEGDKFIDCEGFVPFVDRSAEPNRWDVYWSCDPATEGCEPETLRLPADDKLRETHPEQRPDWLQNTTATCRTTDDCRGTHDLSGTECVGHLVDDPAQACSMDRSSDRCTEGRCLPEWFVGCAPDLDTTGAQAYCVDRRFLDDSTAACFVATAPFQALCDEATGECAGTAQPEQREEQGGWRLSYCDGNEDVRLSAAECCQTSLGGPAEACDPFYQEEVAAIPRYDRDAHLPDLTRDCLCEDDPPPECADVVDASCRDEDGRIRPERAGEYAVRFVETAGGVIYDPAVKGLSWLFADTGGVPRAEIEQCAQTETLIQRRSRHDGWRAHDNEPTRTNEDFDRALCSGQTYEIVFSEPGDDDPYLKDKVGNTLAGRSTYLFETAQFHVVPDSGFPTNNLRVGACDEFGIGFSNKYDLSPENLAKVQIFRTQCDESDDGSSGLVDCRPVPPNEACEEVVPVAGGLGCFADGAALDAAREVDDCARPCLVVDVGEHRAGRLWAQIDPVEFGQVLLPNQTYRLVAPTAPDAQTALGDPAQYDAVFWDVCGMPLVSDNAIDYAFDFVIDEPTCREDLDRDTVPFSCDNAPDHANLRQEDVDDDGHGDVVDLCPTIPTERNTADSDSDGVGNECDSCRRPIKQYNDRSPQVEPEVYMLVRNIAAQTDSDFDGVGDVCDNCVHVANCEDYDADEPWDPGDPIDDAERSLCQTDTDQDLVGDACEGQQAPGAAGPVGTANDDDFDQDGVINIADACPRQPLLDRIECRTPEDCPTDRECKIAPGGTQGLCDHVDSDHDTVGDVCDNCPSKANGAQVLDGGAQTDDPDGDFVGGDCEPDPVCAEAKDPRPFAFYEVAAHGYCCTTALVEVRADEPDAAMRCKGAEPPCLVDRQSGAVLLAPTLLDEPLVPVRLECSDEEARLRVCQRLTNEVRSTFGVIDLPPGCTEALGGRDVSDNAVVTLSDVDDDIAALWDKMCFLPSRDQDFDGVADACDLCDFDFDPLNSRYEDESGRVWQTAGAVCNGMYAPNERCPEDEVDTEGDTETSGGSSGGSSSGGEGEGSSG